MNARIRGMFRLALAGCCTVAAACGDRGAPLSPPAPSPSGPSVPVLAGSLQCTASPRQKTVACAAGTLPGSARGYLIVGGQGSNVQLTSSNVAYDGATHVFSFDVTVQNLIPQPMATTDGVTPDAAGVRVIFASGPAVASGTGNASVANADGTGAFTAAGQPYFQYAGAALGADGILSQNETAGAKRWQLNVDATVGSFVFTLYVVTEVPLPNGWIDVAGSSNVLQGGAQALTGTVHGPTGAISPNQAIAWASANPAVATVDASGNVTGVAAGTTTITATQGPLSAGKTITVCPNMAVGDVLTADAASGASLCFAGGASGNAEYTFMPVNLSQTTALAGLTITPTGIVAVSGPPTPDRIPERTGVSGLRLPAEHEVAASDLPFLQRDLPKLNALLRNPASRVRGGRRAGGFRGTITRNVVPSVGDSMYLNTSSACSGNPSVRRGVVRSVSLNLVVVEDTADPAGGFTTAQYDSIANEFDGLVWDAESNSFGAPTDLDGNGRVVAFFTRAVNELTPPSASSTVLGLFAPKDLFSASDPVNGCTNSNEGELLYMLVPDPAGVVNGVARSVASVRIYTTLTLAHELQHMINAGRRAYVTGTQHFEEGFLDEGLSSVAEEMAFYRASGISPRTNINPGIDPVSGLTETASRVAAYNHYANQNLVRLRGWLQRPDTAGAFKQNPGSPSVRGAIWAFLRYASDRVNGNEQAFWYSLVNSNLEGVANIQNAIGGADPAAWLRDFAAAMYADDAGFTVDAKYTQPSWNFRAVYKRITSASYPLAPQALSNGGTSVLTFSAGGGTAYARFGVTTGTFATLTTSSSSATPYALIVVRTK